MRNALPAALAAAVAMIVLSSCGTHAAVSAAGSANLNVCNGTSGTDPCLPGGQWDPLLQRCNGYGGMPCFGCYSGSKCQTYEGINCTLRSEGGEPLYYGEYWSINNAGSPCTSTPSGFRLQYQDRAGAASSSPPLTPAIKSLHKLHNNAATDGYLVVLGLGATQIMQAALYAKARMLVEAFGFERIEVLVQVPHYMHYPWQVNTTVLLGEDGRAQLPLWWNSSADPHAPNVIEIVTYPNNPDGSRRKPLVQDSSRVIYDCIYYWPQFMNSLGNNTMEPLAHDVMIFSASKHSGHAGSRVGWALVRNDSSNAAMAAYMADFVSESTLGSSVDAQIRALAIMRTVIAQGSGLPSGGFYQVASQLMANRWGRLRGLFGSNGTKNGYTLVNAYDGGAYAWIRCPAGLSCESLFAQAHLQGISGLSFGTTDDYLRLTLMMRTVEIDALLDRVKLRLQARAPQPHTEEGRRHRARQRSEYRIARGAGRPVC
eukprot:PLAT12181.1.p1 GENE.PLAT12181.1~~PLAT12181.1.p1  ORF type:complete len:495 (-),score=186.88 PLAT12181.1:112-1566(-)